MAIGYYQSEGESSPVDLSNYVTKDQLTTASGEIVDYSDLKDLLEADLSFLTTVSGDIISQILTIDPSAIPPQGKLWVPPAYIQTTDDVGVSLGMSTSPGFIWRQDVTCQIPAISFYIKTAAGTDSILAVIYDVTDLPVDTISELTGEYIQSLLAATQNGGYGVVENVSASGWYRMEMVKFVEGSPTTDPFIAVAGQRYVVIFNSYAGIEFEMSARRENETVGSAHPDGCSSRLMTGSMEGGTYHLDITDITQDGEPALLNVVLGSTEDHSPQLVYGRYNGKYLSLYNSDTEVWELKKIPEAGVWINCEEIPANAGYDIAMAWIDGEMLSQSFDTGPNEFQDGIEVFGNDSPTCRVVGGVYLIERQTGLQAPIDVDRYRKVWNLYNAEPKGVTDGEIVIWEYNNWHRTGLDSKNPPIDADSFSIWDSVSSLWRKVTGTNLKAYLKTYFDGIYAAAGDSRLSDARTPTSHGNEVHSSAFALVLPPVVTASASGNLSAAQVSGTFITNLGQTVANVQGFPASVAGMSGEIFIKTAGAGAFSIDPNGSEVFVLDGTTLIAGFKITLATPAVADRITFRCLTAGVVDFTTGQGGWANAGS